MACKRSAVRSRLPPPTGADKAVSSCSGSPGSPSSRGLGHHPFTVSTGVRIPVGTPAQVAGKCSRSGSTLSDQRGYSSAGRALAWHARGQRFDPAYLHHGQTVEAGSIGSPRSPSSRGLGHHPFTVSTGVRIPVGTPVWQRSSAVPQHQMTRPPCAAFLLSAAVVSSPARVPLSTKNSLLVPARFRPTLKAFLVVNALGRRTWNTVTWARIWSPVCTG